MAVAKSARVAEVQQVGEDTRILDLVCGEPLGFVGGQYIIVDSGLVLPSGKAAKRAYSLLSSDADQGRLQLAVKRIPNGLASGFMHEVEVGTEVRFSGPWGKLYPQNAVTGPTLVLATDTGITAALGLIQSRTFKPLLPQTVFIWLRVSPTYFLPETFVRERIPSECSDIRIKSIPSIGHPERIEFARAVLQDVLVHTTLEQAFISGDGSVNYALLDELVSRGISATKDNVESFFNMPKKSV